MPSSQPQPSPADELGQPAVRRAYDTVAADYAALLPDTRAESPLELAMVDAFVAAVATAVDVDVDVDVDVAVDVDEGAHARMLDAGCGAGRMSRHLADRGCSVQGVDLSPGMLEMARRAHPDLDFAVGSLTDLPFPDDHFTGVMLWYSAIHTPPPGQPRVFAEAARVLRPGGHLLVAFQAGEGIRDVSAAYRQLGHEVELERHLYPVDEVAGLITGAGLTEVARMVRRPQGTERDDQAVVLAVLTSGSVR